MTMESRWLIQAAQGEDGMGECVHDKPLVTCLGSTTTS